MKAIVALQPELKPRPELADPPDTELDPPADVPHAVTPARVAPAAIRVRVMRILIGYRLAGRWVGWGTRSFRRAGRQPPANPPERRQRPLAWGCVRCSPPGEGRGRASGRRHPGTAGCPRRRCAGLPCPA